MTMESFTNTILINRPVSEVFAYVEDVSTMSSDLKPVRPVEHVSGDPNEVGYTIRVVTTLMGKRMKNNSTLARFEENLRTTYGSEKPFPMEFTHEYEEAEGGATQLTRTTTADLDKANVFFKMAGPMLLKSTARDTEEGLAKLKDILESQG